MRRMQIREQVFGIGYPAAAPSAMTGPMRRSVRDASPTLHSPKTVALNVHCHGHMLGGHVQSAKTKRHPWTSALPL
ncbi:hypothetical protein [Limnohabitans sp. Rim8]|uniref:hypothetical protein n=1 Tax=Limnohabitans sp. Rim8 TaxID=1100718 RepID=UPI003445A63B